MASTTTDKSDTTAATVDTTSAETASPIESTQATSTKNDDSASLKTDSSDLSSAPITTSSNDQDKAGGGTPQSLQAFTTAVFSGGFNAPKINTSSFFSSMRSTLSNTKSPASLVPPQINKVDMKNLQASTEQLANTTKDWGVSAFKSLSSAAQRVSANVTQGIQKEHEEFVKQKKLENAAPKQGTEAVPAWAGLPDEDQFKSRILSLSKDKRNFLLPPPPGTDFVFDMKVYSSTAMATLKEDPNLNKMRFYLVPKEIEELVFWRNYFYRVTLLKQVALSTAGLDSFSEGISDSTSEGSGGSGGAEGGSNSPRHGRTLSSSVLGYNIYFGKDDVEGPPTRSRPASTTVKDFSPPSTATTTTTITATTTTTKESSNAAVKKVAEKKSEVLFEAEMPDHEEDPDAWLEKQLASGVSIGDGDDVDVDVTDWEKELQNELKDYVEGS
ncbi:Synapse-associated protein 1 [Linnemannia schmuckeri]|uniref:Synapse-associated protein 1 n=1 Tax=Linnemannia schmuckeri TaxID=64567 RepID=A0A9P5S165_9FUNG|nr:Synapse-associated protein 1 [Linnemannia schmuckeri]